MRFSLNVSDGTLRVPGMLVALYQGSGVGATSAKLVGIEQPESALHPAAAGILTDVLQEASERTQVVVTSHSADLLDRDAISMDSILAVVAVNGETQLAPLDKASRAVLREHLLTAGECGVRRKRYCASGALPPGQDPVGAARSVHIR